MIQAWRALWNNKIGLMIIVSAFLGLRLFLIQNARQSNNYVDSSSYFESIHQFDSSIKIQENGKILVTETIYYDFSSDLRHGIYRDIPYYKINTKGDTYFLPISVKSVTDEKGYPYVYTTSYTGQIYRIKIGDLNTLINGLHKYIIRYEVAGAMTYFQDHDELYWNVTGDRWQVEMDSVHTSIALPTNVTLEETPVVCYVGKAGSTNTEQCYIDRNNGQINLSTKGSLWHGEQVTIAVRLPPHSVNRLEPRRIYIPYLYTKFLEYSSSSGDYRILLTVIYVFYLVLPIVPALLWLVWGKDPHVKSKDVMDFSLPKTAEGRELTPAEVGGLIDEHVDLKDIWAMVVDIARRKYIHINVEKKHTFLKKQKDFDDYLLPYEKKFLEKIFGTSEEVDLQKRKLFRTVESTKDEINTLLVDDGFFVKNPEKLRNYFYMCIALCALFLNIPLAFSLFFFGRSMAKRTRFGVSQLAVARSLKRFLSSQSRQLAFQADKKYMFEKFLPYAIAFGVEKIWVERFADADLEDPDWYSNDHFSNSHYFHSSGFSALMGSSYSSFHSSAWVPSASSSSGFSSGFSGGSAGGGGGGGGGGSW